MYHALVNADGGVERLKVRFWTQASGGLQVVGVVVLESDSVTAMHTVNGKTSEQVLELAQRVPLLVSVGGGFAFCRLAWE
ncbi:MAG: hypothetical protein M5U34_16195 [Chloroflexi bacterium]|nr:hypothetical protein [Chloroflexota bacterium]